MKQRILLVEDDSAIAQTLMIAFRSLANVEVVRAFDGEEALRHWDEQPFDVILTDYHMREMSGLELAHHLRERKVTQPIVMITAYDSIQLQREAREVGVTELIPKPFFIDQMLDLVKVYLDHEREEHENQ